MCHPVKGEWDALEHDVCVCLFCSVSEREGRIRLFSFLDLSVGYAAYVP